MTKDALVAGWKTWCQSMLYTACNATSSAKTRTTIVNVANKLPVKVGSTEPDTTGLGLALQKRVDNVLCFGS